MTDPSAEEAEKVLDELGDLYNLPEVKLGGIRKILAISQAKAKREQEKKRRAIALAEQIEKEGQEEEEPEEEDLAPAPPPEDVEEDAGEKEPEAFLYNTFLPRNAPPINFGLMDLCGISCDETLALKLLMATRGLFQHQHASASMLEFAFQLVSFSSAACAPQMALDLLSSAYSKPMDAEWLPSPGDFHRSLLQLGLQEASSTGQGGGAPKADRSAKKRKSSAGDASTATTPEVGCSGNPSRRDPGFLLQLRQTNLQCLLRLLTKLCRLHTSGHVKFDLSLSQQDEGKRLILVLLRLRLDPTVAPLLLRDIQPALAAVMDAWGVDRPASFEVPCSPVDSTSAETSAVNTVWSRMSADLAAKLAEFGPTHRASLAAIKALPAAESPTARALQQAAAMQLAKNLLPKAEAGGSRAGRQRASGVDPNEIRTLVLGGSKETSAAELIASFAVGKREAGKASRHEKKDWWRVMTFMESANLVLWHLTGSSSDNGTEAQELLKWWKSFVQTMATQISGSGNLSARAKTFLLSMHNDVDFTTTDS